MHDKLLLALLEAERVWSVTGRMANKEKFKLAQDLHARSIFSLNQLAKICRTNVPYLSRRLTKVHTVGGRFEPEALGALVEIRRAVLRGETVPDTVLRVAVNAGCSISCIHTLTGVPQTRLYERARKLSTSNY